MRFWNLNFIQVTAVLWVEMEDGAMVRLNAPKFVSHPGDAVRPFAGCRERMDYREIVGNVYLINRSRRRHCHPEFSVAPFQSVRPGLSRAGGGERSERLSI